MTWPNGIAVEETIMALSAKLTVTETRLAEAEALLREVREWICCCEGYGACYGRTPIEWRDPDKDFVRRTWELLTDLIPHVYDTQRNIRVLGVDGAEKYEATHRRLPQSGGRESA